MHKKGGQQDHLRLRRIFTSLTTAQALMENIYEGQVNGLVKCMNTIYKGVRSTSTVFLDGKPNIIVLAETRAKWLVIKNGVAIGVVVYSPPEEDVVYIAKKDVIVSCGV